MRVLITRCGRTLAAMILLTMLAHSIAMAAYVCPQALAGIAPAASQRTVIDDDMPAHCAERQSGDKPALEHSGDPPSLSLPAVVSVAWRPAVSTLPRRPVTATLSAAEPRAAAPPLLRTLRLRL